MRMNDIAFGTTDWSSIEPTEHRGHSGAAYWRTREFGGIRVRMVEYTPGYVADHWCSKGHILLRMLHRGLIRRSTPGTDGGVSAASDRR
jgi:hypothetical protein